MWRPRSDGLESKEDSNMDLVLNFNRFQNLARLWEFVEGNLGGICTWGFFLKSSRLLKDF
jgi:hypothetical protein